MRLPERRVKKPVAVSEVTLEFHRRALVIDLHTDSLLAARMLGLDLARRHRAPLGMTPWMLHADFPRMAEAGIDAAFFGIVTHPWPRKAWRRALERIAFAKRVFEKNADGVVLATSPGEVERARGEGRLAALLGVEGMHMISGEPGRLETLYRLGVRYVTMAHFTSNAFAPSSADGSAAREALPGPGREAVALMNELGMMIDVSHTRSDAIEQVCRITRQPVIVSHGAVSALRASFRNLSDEDVKRVAGTGGVIGLIYCSKWLSSGTGTPHLEVVVDHADHIKRLVGAEHLALGSDWDGLIKTPDAMNDVTDLPALTQLFFDRGYGEDEVEGILGKNFMRVFEQVSGA